MQILIIEDEKILSKILKNRFEEEGWNVKTAFNGLDGLREIRDNSFDVVLLDLLLPIKNGFEVLKEIRSESSYKKLPVLVISNLGGKDEVKEAMDLGANDYFIKTQHSLDEIVKKAASYVS